MSGGGNIILVLAFVGIAGLTLMLVLHQLVKIKQLDAKLRAREEAAFEAATTETRQAG
jgi:hypothetical protein